MYESTTKVVQIMTPGLTLTQFTLRSKFGHIGFCMGKSENYLFLETIAALGRKVD